MTVRRLTAAITLLGLLAAAAPARADEQAAGRSGEPRHPGQIARDAADDLMRRLEELAASLPRFGLPQIAENGDIVIPRLDRAERDAPGRLKPPPAGDALDL